ncbi:MAG: YwiC-like family protein [Actinomycetota bacterium]|nr:YwiC-like family protein [Actinomycetota bacterium]
MPGDRLPVGETAARQRSAAAPTARSTLRAVAVPSEHGGWGLTLEPALLGLLVGPSIAGACLAGAALVAFVARTPAKAVLVDVWRRRRTERGRVAQRVLAVELVVGAALVVVAAALADGAFWVPVAIAAPLVAMELWFDMRSRSRRLVPELAGAVGIGAVAAAIVAAGAGSSALAAAVWAIVAARSVTAIPHVRALIARLHGRVVDRRVQLVADGAAAATAAAATLVEPSVGLGGVAVVAVVTVQRVESRRPPLTAKIVGVRQMALGFAVVLATALGVTLT